MFGIGIPELLLIMALALIVIGPDKLPQLAKQIARFAGELKRASEDFKKQLDLDKIEELKDLTDIKKNVSSTIRETASDLVWPDDIKGHPSDSRALEEERKKHPAHGNTPGGLGPEWKIAEGHASKKDPADKVEDVPYGQPGPAQGHEDKMKPSEGLQVKKETLKGNTD